jgi:hypothetical protein
MKVFRPKFLSTNVLFQSRILFETRIYSILLEQKQKMKAFNLEKMLIWHY